MAQKAKVEDVASALDGIEITDDAELIDDNSPLHNAASRGHANYLEALLNAGASPNSRDPYGNSLLHLAAMHGTHDQGFNFRRERGRFRSFRPSMVTILVLTLLFGTT